MENIRSNNTKNLVLVVGFIIVVLILVCSIITIYKIGGFTNVNELLFFIKRKIIFVTYKLYDVLF